MAATGDVDGVMKALAPRASWWTSPWTLAGVLVLIFLATTVALDHRALAGDQYDDSYITYRYAMNLATGKGLVFNSYERLNSASSFLYTVVLASVYAAGFHDLERFATVFGLAMGSLLVVVTFFTALKLSGRRGLAFGFVFPLCTAGSIGGWAVSGMDTIFFAALVAVFLRLYLFVDVPRRAAFAVLGLVALCRTEGVILVAVVAGCESLTARRTREYRDLVWLVALAVVPTAALAVFDLAYYGAVLPHSLYLKRLTRHYSPGLGLHAATLARFYATYYLGYLALAVAAIVAAGRSFVAGARGAEIQPRLLLGAYVIVSVASFMAGPSADGVRYTVHLLPVLAVLALAGWVDVVSSRFREAAMRRIALVTVMVLVAVGALGDEVRAAADFNQIAANQRVRKEMALWLTRHARPGDVIASADLGEIAYFAPEHDFVDVFGLTSGGFAELSQTRPDLLMAEFARRRPAYIADMVRPARRSDPDGHIPLQPVTELILADPSIAFRNVTVAPTPARLPCARNQVLAMESGGLTFGVVALDWTHVGASGR